MRYGVVMYGNDYRHPERIAPDPFLLHFAEVLKEVTDNFMERQHVRGARGDEPLTTMPFITVTIETESRTYSGRVFDVRADDATIDLFHTGVRDPAKANETPKYTVRASSIVAGNVAENVKFLPVEFEMKKADLDAHVEEFLTTAESIFVPGSGKHDLNSKQCDALREAAKPVFELIFKSNAVYRWEQYTTAIAARCSVNTDTIRMPSKDKRLNLMVATPHDGSRKGLSLLHFLTLGVPLEFLYTETHQQVLDSFADTAHDRARR